MRYRERARGQLTAEGRAQQLELFETGERKILQKIPQSVDAQGAAEGRGGLEQPHVWTVHPVL